MANSEEMDQLAINTMRMLVVDAVQKAKSGHPGTPMDAAPAAYTLWQRVLRYDPAEPGWINRDRFVLSSGHASMLLYSLIHLAGIKAANRSYEQPGRDAVTLDDIKTFRQAGSRCPGHPEYGWTSGVETTTGPLGQGVATSVGMAIAGAMAAGHLQSPGLRSVRLQRLCAVRRRRHDGRRRQRGRLAGRAPASRQSVLDLRQQPRDDRRPYRYRLHRGCGGALPGLWLERAARDRRQRHGTARDRLSRVSRSGGPADA